MVMDGSAMGSLSNCAVLGGSAIGAGTVEDL